MIAAIVTAAGYGRRMRLGQPKQFVHLHTKSILEHTMDQVFACAWLDQVVLVLPPDQGTHIKHPKLKMAVGGDTRQESVYKGLCALEDQCTKVLIHDGVRCLVTSDQFKRVVDACKPPWDGSVTGYPIRDTLKKVKDGCVVSTLDRQNVWAVQTPQAFFVSAIRAAYEKAKQDKFEATDDVQLIEHAGGQVKMVQGGLQNIKPTYPEDLELVQTLLLPEHKR